MVTDGPALLRSDAGLSEEITAEITRVMADRGRRAGLLSSSLADSWAIAQRCVLGGKQLRPQLLVLAFDALAQSSESFAENRASVLRIAAGLEVLHYAFLLHDDLIDGDLVRRGRPNLMGAHLVERDPAAVAGDGRPTTGPRRDDLHWARANGLLIGDLMLSAAHHVVAAERLAEGTRRQVVDLFDDAIMESVAGEHLDAALSDGCIEPDETTVITMTAQKTAAYSFELPLRLGVVLAGGSTGCEAVLAEIGRTLGLAFQLDDDLASTFGDPAVHGKDAFSDLREGKQTAIVEFARGTSAWLDIGPVLGDRGLDDDQCLALRAILTACGAEDHVRSRINDLRTRALSLLSAQTDLDGTPLADFLTEIAATLPRTDP